LNANLRNVVSKSGLVTFMPESANHHLGFENAIYSTNIPKSDLSLNEIQWLDKRFT